jgi:hypothetical protein
VPFIVDLTAITYQEVSLRDFPPSSSKLIESSHIHAAAPHSTSPRTSPRTHGILESGLEFFRHVEETLIPKTVRNKTTQQTKSPTGTHNNTSAKISAGAQEQFASHISFGESLGDCYSYQYLYTSFLHPFHLLSVGSSI